MLPLAAAAEAEVLAYGLHTLVRQLLEVQDLAFEEVLLALVDLDVDHVAGHAKGDEDHTPFRLGHRHAFGTRVDDLDVFDVFRFSFYFVSHHSLCSFNLDPDH